MTEPVDIRRLEHAIASSVFVFGKPALADVLDAGVRPEHLTDPAAQGILAAAGQLFDTDRHLDQQTLIAQLAATGTLPRVGHALRAAGLADPDMADDLAVDALAVRAVGPGPALRTAISQLGDALRWQVRTNAAQQLAAAAAQRDDDAWAAAEDRAAHAGEHRAQARRHVTADQAALELLHRLDGTTTPSERFPMPWTRLNELTGGGLRRRKVVIVAGPTSHGKSAALDQMLQTMCPAGTGRRPLLYLNEMDREERMERIAAELSGVHLDTIQQAAAGTRPLTKREADRVLRGLQRNVIEPVDATGWMARDIARHARRHRPDVIAVDIVNRLKLPPGIKRHEGLQDAADELDRLGKDIGAVVIIAAHVNRERAKQDGRWPLPSITDLKDAAALGEIADQVLMVWRRQDPESLDPEETGVMRFAKNRGGRLGGIKVEFLGELQRWTQLDEQHGADATRPTPAPATDGAASWERWKAEHPKAA